MVVSLSVSPLTSYQMGQVEGINMKGVIQQEYALSLPGALPDYNQLHQSLTLLKLYAMSLTFFSFNEALSISGGRTGTLYSASLSV